MERFISKLFSLSEMKQTIDRKVEVILINIPRDYRGEALREVSEKYKRLSIKDLMKELIFFLDIIQRIQIIKSD